MPGERITVAVSSNFGEDGPLTVQDGLYQILDLFALLESAQHSVSTEIVSWNLVTISKSSPLTATAEAISMSPGLVPDAAARFAKATVFESLTALMAGSQPPDWMNDQAREIARRILSRNLNGVGRTDIIFDPDSAPMVILEKSARIAVRSLDLDVISEQQKKPDLSRQEMGSLEGYMGSLATYYGQPAIRIRERLTGNDVPCVITPELLGKIGDQPVHRDVWTGKRVLVVGRIFYKQDGTPARIDAIDMKVMIAPVREERSFPGFLGSLTPQQYLDDLWADDDG